MSLRGTDENSLLLGNAPPSVACDNGQQHDDGDDVEAGFQQRNTRKMLLLLWRIGLSSTGTSDIYSLHCFGCPSPRPDNKDAQPPLYGLHVVVYS